MERSIGRDAEAYIDIKRTSKTRMLRLAALDPARYFSAARIGEARRTVDNF